MTDHVRQVASRLSLREPQRRSLELLEEVTRLVELRKGADLVAALAAVRARFPQIEDFERAFPSFCFALATGVGKTRLMGAFVAWLHAAFGVQHYLVLAPNLTIYEKLIRDFTPGTEKYVLAGIGTFATYPPVVVTGDNYESGIGVRRDMLFDTDTVHVNIFNIAKINSEARGGNSPRIKRLAEYIGESYFEYLSGLPDLVLLMDESHRYRASAGVRAINELSPVLGLELTATPQVQAGAQSIRFKNVLYDYPLGKAMDDGFVKEPAVATRADLAVRDLPGRELDSQRLSELDALKLADGVTLHEHTKVELDAYARDTGQRRVKPFMLVVTADTRHAEKVAEHLRSEAFRGGAYTDKVLTVHSKKTGAERDEVVAELLQVESVDNPIEIVIHVDMLKEGWDVTNLYTIVPLRTAASGTLVEQSIGRGLRLPYGRRTGNKAVDRLTIVAHDKFQEIVDAAKDPNSRIGRQFSTVVIGEDVSEGGRRVVEVEPRFVELIRVTDGAQAAPAATGTAGDQAILIDGRAPQAMFSNSGEVHVAMATMEVIRDYGTRQARSARLLDPDIQAEVVRRVQARIPPQQLVIEGLATPLNVAATVERAARLYINNTIDIPRIVVQPVGEVRRGYQDFDLDLGGFDPPLIDQNLLVQHLRTNDRELLATEDSIVPEPRLENHIVKKLMDLPAIDYDTHSELLYRLAGQAIAHLRAKHGADDKVMRVLLYSRAAIVSLIAEQMERNYVEQATRYEVSVPRGFEHLEAQCGTAAADEEPRDLRRPIADKPRIRGMLFAGMDKCLYGIQRFQSDPEREFAVLLEDCADVLKWAKPKDGSIKIYWSPEGRHDSRQYNPDFVIETRDRCYLAEVKAAGLLGNTAGQILDAEVRAKARAAVRWCEHATEHARSCGGKPWAYLLVPDIATGAGATFGGITTAHLVPPTALSA